MTDKNNYGLGYSPLSDNVYWGRQNKAKSMWVGEKKDVTQSFIATAFAYFEVNTIRTIGSGKDANLFINIKKDPSSIKKIIKHLQKNYLKK